MIDGERMGNDRAKNSFPRAVEAPLNRVFSRPWGRLSRRQNTDQYAQGTHRASDRPEWPCLHQGIAGLCVGQHQLRSDAPKVKLGDRPAARSPVDLIGQQIKDGFRRCRKST